MTATLRRQKTLGKDRCGSDQSRCLCYRSSSTIPMLLIQEDLDSGIELK